MDKIILDLCGGRRSIMAQTDWLDKALDELINQIEWSVLVPGAVEIDRNKQQLAKSEATAAIRKHMAEERIDELQNIPGRRAHEGKYIVDIADITDRIAALQQRQPEGE